MADETFLDIEKIDSMKVDALKLELEKRNLSKTGNKVDLQNRLKDWATSNDRDDILNKSLLEKMTYEIQAGISDEKPNESSPNPKVKETITNFVYEKCNDYFSKHFTKEILNDIKNSINILEEGHRNTDSGAQSQLIKTLESEIQFLRGELASKNKIIELLISDKSVSQSQKLSKNERFNKENSSNMTSKFENPKKTFKKRSVLENDQNDSPSLPTQNRFNCLPIIDDESYTNYESTTKTHKKKNTVRNQKREGVQNQNRNHNTAKNDVLDDVDTDTNVGNKKRVISIVGDSIIKYVKGYELSNENTRVIVKSFPGARTNCMKHYVEPSLTYQPDLMILHCGTNDLKHEENNETITTDIMNLAMEISKKSHVCISALTPRNDRFKDRVSEINNILEFMCKQRNIGFIWHDNIDPRKHLNRSKLHLNKEGTCILTENFRFSLKD